jgi:stage V sporulation protein B
MVCGQQIGILIYNNSEVGFLLTVLSPIIPFMYLDALCDGILKGLDQQKFTFFTSVADSFIRIVLILLLLDKFGIFAFIGIMYFSNFLTGILNTTRLLNVSGVKLDYIKNVFLPILCGFTTCLFLKFVFKGITTNIFYVLVICAICLPLYLLTLSALHVIGYDDLSFLKRK